MSNIMSCANMNTW